MAVEPELGTMASDIFLSIGVRISNLESYFSS